MQAKYDVLPFIFSEEIARRASINKPFLQEEMWYVVYTVNLAGAIAHTQATTLGDVRP
jgi:hypothetical protein